MEPDKIQIDGSVYQGGGQIIRSSLALSIILNKPFFIHSIRKNRPNPGMNNQLRAILQPFMARPLIPKNSTSQLQFNPTNPNIEKVSSNTSSSCTLMLQCLIPIAAFLHIQKPLIVEGGTDVSKSPPLQSFTTCLIPLLKRMGIEVNIQKVKKGYYPRGGGSIAYSIKLNKLTAINLTQFHPPTFITITYYLKKNPLPQTHTDLKKGIKRMMRQKFGQALDLDIQIKIQIVGNMKGANYGIGCIMRSQNNSVIWDCSLVGEETTEEVILGRLKEEIENDGCLDEHHQDQLIIYMALAQGTSRIRIGHKQSDHTKSMLYVLQKFIPNIKIKFQDDILQIQGINFLAKHLA